MTPPPAEFLNPIHPICNEQGTERPWGALVDNGHALAPAREEGSGIAMRIAGRAEGRRGWIKVAGPHLTL